MSPADVEKKIQSLMVEAQKIALENNLCFVAAVDDPADPENNFYSLHCGFGRPLIELFNNFGMRLIQQIQQMNEPGAGGAAMSWTPRPEDWVMRRILRRKFWDGFFIGAISGAVALIVWVFLIGASLGLCL